MLFGAVRARIDRAARRIWQAGLGALCLLIGAGFMVALAWMAIAETWSAMIATAAIGAAFLAVGGIFLLASRSERQGTRPAHVAGDGHPGNPPSVNAVLAAFTAGVQAGQSARRPGAR